jgi:hypothetical protein
MQVHFVQGMQHTQSNRFFRDHRPGVFGMMQAFSSFGLSLQSVPFEQQLRTHGSGSVHELLADGEMAPQADTTVMTTVDCLHIDCLHKKGLLDRIAEGRAFRYPPRHSREEPPRDAQPLDVLRLLVEPKRWELRDQGKTREQC